MRRMPIILFVIALLFTACADNNSAQSNIALLESPVPQVEAPGPDVLNIYPVAVDMLEPGGCVLLGEVSVETGQTIHYNIAFEGRANVQVGLIPPGSDSEDPDLPAFFSLSVLGGSNLIGRTEPATAQSAGSYTLCLRNLGGDSITDVMGTVQTIVENTL